MLKYIYIYRYNVVNVIRTATSLVCFKYYTSPLNNKSEQLFQSSGIYKPKPAVCLNPQQRHIYIYVCKIVLNQNTVTHAPASYVYQAKGMMHPRNN